MRSTLFVGAFLFLALIARSADAEKIVLSSGHVGLRAVTGPKVTRRAARLVLDESRRAFDAITKGLGVGAGHIFHLHRRPPFWMAAVDRSTPYVWVHLEERPRILDRNADAYFDRMRRGLLRVHIPAPDGDLGPEDLRRIWGGMARAILAQTGWRSLPLWLREGLSESFAGRGSNDAHARIAAMKRELVDLSDAVPVAAVLEATDRSAWSRRSGRAIGWALVRMLGERDERIVRRLYAQVRMLVAHLASYPDELTVKREHADLVRDQLAAHGAPPEVLQRALVAWVKEGFPTSPAFRKCQAGRILDEAKPPTLFRVGLSARFGRTVTGPGGSGELRQNKDVWGGAVWSLPWPTTMQAWIGVHGKRGRDPGADRDLVRQGFVLEYPAWSAERVGRRGLRRRTMSIIGTRRTYGLAWLGVTSPNGVRYLYEYEIRLK